MQDQCQKLEFIISFWSCLLAKNPDSLVASCKLHDATLELKKLQRDRQKGWFDVLRIV